MTATKTRRPLDLAGYDRAMQDVVDRLRAIQARYPRELHHVARQLDSETAERYSREYGELMTRPTRRR